MKEKRGKYRKAIFCVAYSKTPKGIKYLLLKRKKHWKGWEFPKGKIEWYELLNKRKTVLRETKEETGLEIKRKTLKKHNYFGRYLYEKPLKDRPKIIGQTYSLYSGEVPYSNNVSFVPIEHNGFKWVSFKQALNLLTWDNQKKALKIINEWLNKN
jgi:8-oxo-dGTP pyrophosphatase MutT (NUDIX family)